MEKLIKNTVRTVDRKELERFEGEPALFGQVMLEFEQQKFAVDLKKLLVVDDMNLMETIVNHAGTYGWWASLSESVERSLRAKKRLLESKKDSMDMEARNALRRNAIKVTEAGVKAYFGNDPRLKELSEEIFELEDMKSFLQCVLKSLEHRREMIKHASQTLATSQINQR